MMDFARVKNGRTLLTLNLIGDTTMILFKILKNMNKEMKEAYGKYYAYPVITKTVDIDGLAKQMAAYNTGFSEGQVKGMLADMVKRIKENITNGFAVKIDDLAIFTCGIVNKEGAADKAKFSVAANIESIKLRARATGELTSTARLRSWISRSLPIFQAQAQRMALRAILQAAPLTLVTRRMRRTRTLAEPEARVLVAKAPEVKARAAKVPEATLAT